MKFVSIDIETTGLNPKVHVPIEFAAVLGDTQRPDPIATLRVLVPGPQAKRKLAAPWCQEHLAELFDELEEQRTMSCKWYCYRAAAPRLSVAPIHCLVAEFNVWLHQCGLYEQKITFAGKNVAGFDLRFLEEQVPRWNIIKYHHRTIDPALHYARADDACMPDLATCLERAGLPAQVKHRALDDALAVHSLVVKAFGH